MDILKMSKIDFSRGGLAKKVKKVIVTIMLSFPFLDQKCCDANFFPFLFYIFKNDLGIFFVRIIYLKILTKKMPKTENTFCCKKCAFKCSKKSNYTKHLLTLRHQNLTNPNFFDAENAKHFYTCQTCNKHYKHASTLSAHKKKCLFFESGDDSIKTITLMVVDLMKSNADLQKQMLEVCKNSAYQTTHINNHSNSHNKTFNLQFFLNETCKDAMNIMDFVDSFTLQLSDLEDVSKQGYVDGISNIIMKKLNELDVHKRPIHCSDAKREIMYVKDQNKWEKEDLGYTKLRKAIKYISKKNSDLLGQWSEAHPASKNITTQTNTEYMKMIVQAMGGKGEIGENENKIIKKIAKTVLIEKI